MKYFDHTKLYTDEIQPLLDKIHDICVANDIPMVVLISIANIKHHMGVQNVSHHLSANKNKDIAIQYINHFIREDMPLMLQKYHNARDIITEAISEAEIKNSTKH